LLGLTCTDACHFMKTLLCRILGPAILCWALFAPPGWATEKNPPGDIPDDQVFVVYTSAAGGYRVKVPEGWKRTEQGPDVGFIDKFDGIAVTVDAVAAAPTAKDVVSRLEKTETGLKVEGVKEIRLPNGPTLRAKYETDSEVNPVTNKRIRLEKEAYVFYKDGKVAILTLWAPLGADNADQWKLMSESFHW
jgi:hypothetical protein